MSFFITVEGIEGSGKSSVVDYIYYQFLSSGQEALKTREPGATPLGKCLRKLILDQPDDNQLSTSAELLMFAADRAEHIEKIIQPALTSNINVICDRYIHSTLAYQGYAKGISLDWLRQLNSLPCFSLMPDLVLLLDLNVEEGLQRAHRRELALLENQDKSQCSSWNHFEKQNFNFHQRVRQGFLALANQAPEQFVIVDASQPKDIVARDCWEAIKHRLKV